MKTLLNKVSCSCFVIEWFKLLLTILSRDAEIMEKLKWLFGPLKYSAVDQMALTTTAKQQDEEEEEYDAEKEKERKAKLERDMLLSFQDRERRFEQQEGS